MRAALQLCHSRVLTELHQEPCGRTVVPRLPGVPPEAAAPIRPAPGIGEHMIAVLEGLGAPGAEIASLLDDGVVVAGRGQATAPHEAGLARGALSPPCCFTSTVRLPVPAPP